MHNKEFEQLIWLATYIAAITSKTSIANQEADAAVSHYRNSKILHEAENDG